MNVLRRTSILALVCALLMVGAAVAPFAAIAGNHDDDAELEFDLEQVENEVVVDVEYNDSPAENATVNITNVSDFEYEANGTTDANGTVSFEGPVEDVTVNVTVTHIIEGDNESETEFVNETREFQLSGHPGLEIGVEQDDDANVTVTITDNWTAVEGANVTVETVEENASYAGTGNHTSDEDGEVALPAPEETVDVNISAVFENKSASTTSTLFNESDFEEGNQTPFGQLVSEFVHGLKEDNNTTGIGPLVAKFVLEHNPGNPPDHAGPPAFHFDNGNFTPGPPAHAGPKDDGERGPPDHAGPKDDADSEDDDDRRGPPDRARGNGGGNGNPGGNGGPS